MIFLKKISFLLMVFLPSYSIAMTPVTQMAFELVNDRKCSEKYLQPLVDMGLDLNAKNSHGYTLLGLSHNRLECVDFLIRSGAKANISYGNTPLMFVVIRGGNPDIINRLLSTGIDLHMLRDKYGQTALIIVANMDGKYEARNKIASFLIEKGYDDLINIKDKSGASPFRYAARSNDDQMMELFIKKGLNIHEPVEEASGGTPLHFAAKYGKFSGKSVEMLINAGADVNAKDKRGRTPFSWYKSRHYINRDIGLALMSAGAK